MADNRCPVCRREPQHRLAGSGYVLHVCGRHLGVARSVTGIGLVARRRRDAGEPVLFEMGGGR